MAAETMASEHWLSALGDIAQLDEPQQIIWALALMDTAQDRRRAGGVRFDSETAAMLDNMIQRARRYLANEGIVSEPLSVQRPLSKPVFSVAKPAPEPIVSEPVSEENLPESVGEGLGLDQVSVSLASVSLASVPIQYERVEQVRTPKKRGSKSGSKSGSKKWTPEMRTLIRSA